MSTHEEDIVKAAASGSAMESEKKNETEATLPLKPQRKQTLASAEIKDATDTSKGRSKMIRGIPQSEYATIKVSRKLMNDSMLSLKGCAQSEFMEALVSTMETDTEDEIEMDDSMNDSMFLVGSSLSEYMEDVQSAAASEYVAKNTLRNMEDITLELIRKNEKEGKQKAIARYQQLYIAVKQGDWKQVEDILTKEPEALTASISETSETTLHLIAESDQDATFQLLNRFLPIVPPESLETVDVSGDTALFSAAGVGNTEAAQLLVKFNKKLPNITNKKRKIPLHLAAFAGHKETVNYLLSVIELNDSNEDRNPLAGKRGYFLVKNLLQANLYDIAFDLLKRYPKLARENPMYRRKILEMLARKPTSFASGSRPGFWQQFIYCCPQLQGRTFDYPQTQKNAFPLSEIVDGDTENPIQRPQILSRKSTPSGLLQKFGASSQKLHLVFWKVLMKLAPRVRCIHDKKLKYDQTVEIIRMMCGGVSWSFKGALEVLKMPILTAARFGIHEIVEEITKAFPDSLVFHDKDGNNVFMLAILHRQENVFKLKSLMGTMKKLAPYFKHESHNILYLAGTLAPASHVPGAALQMQRELQWFKIVENLVPLSFREARTRDNKTPREYFTEQHKELVKEGEKWMKDTATSCTIVASLIITIVFAAAITVPGGNDSEGMPNFLHQVPFIVFVISDALALFASTSSLLMFLGILTSRYSEDDFLVSLPQDLIVGLIALFLSIATMMVAFGATIYIVLSHPWKWVIIPIALLGCAPVTLFALLQFPLLLDMIISTGLVFFDR